MRTYPLAFAALTAFVALPLLPAAAASGENVTATACGAPTVCSTVSLRLDQFFCFTRASDGDRECDAQWTITLDNGANTGGLDCARAWAPAYYENYDWGISQTCASGARSKTFWSYHRPTWFGTTQWELDATVCSDVLPNRINEGCATTPQIVIYFY